MKDNALIYSLSPLAASECPKIFNLPDTQIAVLMKYIVEVSPSSLQPAGPRGFPIRTDSPEYCDMSGIKI